MAVVPNLPSSPQGNMERTPAGGEKRIAFERATDLAASQLAFFMRGNGEPTENERLLAGHIVGNLWANDLLNTAGENWQTVSRESQLLSLRKEVIEECARDLEAEADRIERDGKGAEMGFVLTITAHGYRQRAAAIRSLKDKVSTVGEI